jgi:predicted PurR-regulated permease PerM
MLEERPHYVTLPPALAMASGVAVCVLGTVAGVWGLTIIGQQFQGMITMLGIVLVMTYVLLGPVNLLTQTITRVARLLGRYYNWPKWLVQRCRVLSRVTSILLVYLLFLVLALVASIRLTPTVLDQFQTLQGHWPTIIERAENWLLDQPIVLQYFRTEVEDLRKRLRPKATPPRAASVVKKTTTTTVKTNLSTEEKKLIREEVINPSVTNLLTNPNQSTNGVLRQVASRALNFVGGALAALIYVLTGIILTFYLLLDGAKLREHFIDFLPDHIAPSVSRLLDDTHDIMFGFVKGQVFLGLFTGLFMIVVYSLFNVPYAFLLGSFFGISEILPVVGTWLGFLPGILVMLVINPIKLLALMAVVYVYQTIKDNIVAPKVLGDTMGLHPVVVMLSLLICSQVAGLIGVLYAIPLASLLKAVLVKVFKKS